MKGDMGSFNPCFNGTMYKNSKIGETQYITMRVSILVLMELCIKTIDNITRPLYSVKVSILVLMELCIKTVFPVFQKKE